MRGRVLAFLLLFAAGLVAVGALSSCGGGGGGTSSTTSGGTSGSGGTTGSATPTTPPAVPANLKTVAGANSLTVSWDASAEASSYTLYWSVVPHLTASQCSVKVGSLTAASYLHAGLEAELAYYYFVTAENGAGVSAAASVVSGVPSGTTWKKGFVDRTGDTGRQTAIVLDGNNKAHISYVYADTPAVKYASNATGPWIAESVQTVSNAATGTSIARTSGGTPYISFFNNDLLAFATNKTGAWVTEAKSVSSTALSGFYTAMAFDAADKAHLCVYDGVAKNLVYLFPSTGVTGQAFAPKVTFADTVVDSAGDVGAYCSIAVDGNGKPHISYLDLTNGALKYATNASGSWVAITVDSGGIGGDTAIAVDGNNTAHVAYYDTSAGDLKFATSGGGAWSTATVDSGGDVGRYAAIDIDGQNYAHISYLDATNGALKYATNKGGAWTTEMVESLGVEGHTAIAVDTNGWPHISYYVGTNGADDTNYDLKYATTAAGVPSPPEIRSLTASYQAFNVSWVGAGTAVYNLYWSISSTVSKTSYEGKFPCIASPYLVGGLSGGTPYYLVLTAETGAGESAETVVWTVTPTSTPPATGGGGDSGGGGGAGGSCPVLADICYSNSSGTSYAGTVIATCSCPAGTSQYGGLISISGVDYRQCVCN